MGDPVLNNGLNLAVWLILIVKTLAVFVIVLVSVVFMVMYERKAVAQLGVRYGPNRAGPNGWLQSVADGTKLLFKESFTPRTPTRPSTRPPPTSCWSRPCWSSRSCLSGARSPSPVTRPTFSWPTPVGDPLPADVLGRLASTG